ncbi:hypothetical protein FIBSPDRAFT_924495 [Athelia psychrophila]|uniref:GST N-terminal domain-containing protein n=1 Tax=Athelia psychrophila TaxID=1759441 RepID=A0A166W924_9AGAM|nr:hypothetical protein FIBSPDRAFT_924495 [Fibularhizoctonia sp. CBS 109695]
MSAAAEPVIALQKPSILYTGKTPNGYQASILLEELKIAYGSSINVDYEYVFTIAYQMIAQDTPESECRVHKVEFSKQEHKEPRFFKIHPNGQIPALVDRTRGDFAVFESAVILLCLEQHYDREREFTFDAHSQPDEYSEMLQWIFFAHGGISPAQTQAIGGTRLAAVVGFINETKRLYGVLQLRLENCKYLAETGEGSFSIADIKIAPCYAFFHDGYAKTDFLLGCRWVFIPNRILRSGSLKGDGRGIWKLEWIVPAAQLTPSKVFLPTCNPVTNRSRFRCYTREWGPVTLELVSFYESLVDWQSSSQPGHPLIATAKQHAVEPLFEAALFPEVSEEQS